MVYEPLHHKYRPKTFADLVGQEAIATTLINAIRQQRIAPAYLFSGPRGTGKTSSARILAKSLNCLNQPQPTEAPCGTCEACTAIARGDALDVIEIDAASNTGVDNIRDLIEKAQFAPVQCRYKVYVIDECITGNSSIQTQTGLMRIDDPNIQGQRVLSYNEDQGIWEYKKVVRWLNQGVKQTLMIKTNNREVHCTDNHLIRTDQGWIAAKNIKEGMRILSPVVVDVEHLSTSTAQIDVFVDLPEDISSKVIDMGKSLITWKPFLNKQSLSGPSVLVGVEKDWKFLNFYNRRDVVLEALNLIGKDIRIKNVTEFGKLELRNFWKIQKLFLKKHWDLFMGLFWETPLLHTPILTVGFLDWLGITAQTNKNGQVIRRKNYQCYVPSYGYQKTSAMDKWQFFAIQFVTHNLEKFLMWLNATENKNLFQWIGFPKLPQKDLLGGIWMMDHSVSIKPEVNLFTYIQRDFQNQNIKLLRNGLINWVTFVKQNSIKNEKQSVDTAILNLDQKPQKNGSLISDAIQFHQWDTNFETVKSVEVSTLENVYDLEVEDNHNFVANGLLVHNCHMLSTAAFNALLKTLEEPPDRIVFVLATTDPQRVLPTIISRCQRFDFRRIPLESMVRHLSTIAAKETIDIVNPAITLVAQLAQGGLRDAESLLDQLSLLPPPVTPEAVWDLVGAVPERDLLALVQAIVSDDPESVIDRARHLMNRGREPLIVLQNLASFYRDLLIAKTAPQRGDMVAVTEETWQEMCALVKTMAMGTILQGQQHLRSSETQLKNTTQPRLWLEVTLMGLLPSALNTVLPTTTGSIPSAQLQAVQFQPVQTSTTTPIATSQGTPVQPSTPPVYSAQGTTAPVQSTPVQSSTPPEGITAAVENVPGTIAPPVNISEGSVVASVQPDDDCAALWDRTLARTRTASAKALFSQQAQLISFNGSRAIVAVRSTLLKLAESKLQPIQEAMSQVVGTPVNIQLQPSQSVPTSHPDAITPSVAVTGGHVTGASVAKFHTTGGDLGGGTATGANLIGGNPSSVNSTGGNFTDGYSTHGIASPPISTSSTPIPPNSPEVLRPQDVMASSLTATMQAPPRTEAAPTIAPQPLTQTVTPSVAAVTTSQFTVAPPPIYATPSVAGTPTKATPMTQIWNEDEALRAAKTIAEFFNGQVVLDPDIVQDSESSSSDVTAVEEDVDF